MHWYGVSNNDQFLEAYRAVRREVERFALFVERDRDNAADLLHNALVSALRAWGRIGDAPSLKSYLISSMLRMHRRGKRHAERFEISEMDSLVAPDALSPEVAADMRIVRDAIAMLPDAERIPFVLAEVEGWPLADIAKELNIGLSAVKMRVKRGRDKLIALLQEKPMVTEETPHV
ncbi:MAG: RNA polymerase sigma factor [Candidatus Kapabacteria bacterium]|nr:RNA polymerase sigma factor [Ignavibacteria bacterium]MBK7032897.1 RNA polymerase sigma factor [Ignavibacteria bacterium]MBK7413600.1 RNA polymerase sigma factor [Ignavibacteria bacterium]MBP6510619.1 RNA polymerase sigma factor [Candidatus Kapabacteria bacterium]